MQCKKKQKPVVWELKFIGMAERTRNDASWHLFIIGNKAYCLEMIQND